MHHCVTKAELQGYAAQALNMALRDIEQTGGFNFLLAVCHSGETPPFYRMRKVEELVVEKLGEDWLNSGSTKDIGFDMLRLMVTTLPPEAVVFCTAANAFKGTDKLAALPAAEQLALLRASHDRHHQAAKEGLLELHDTLIALAQTLTLVCQYVQEVDHGKFVGKPDTTFFPQEGFEGRLKLYGGDLDDALHFFMQREPAE